MLEPQSTSVKRERLSRDRVFPAAVKIADVDGLGALTMRSLAQELGVKPMSLYYYVRNKEEILDGIVDWVFAEIALPKVGRDWRAEVTRRAVSARAALARHPWALALMEARTNPGPATLRHHDAMLGTLRAGGFSLSMTAHAYRSRAPRAPPRLPIRSWMASPAATIRIWLNFATQHVLQPGYDFGAQFDFGLDLILDGLAAQLQDGNLGQGPRPGSEGGLHDYGFNG